MSSVKISKKSMSITQTSKTIKEFGSKSNNCDMLEVMRNVSRDLFDIVKFEYWGNVVIAGGYAMDLLLNTNTSDDIDIFIYNADKDLIDKIYSHVVHLSGGKVAFENVQKQRPYARLNSQMKQNLNLLFDQ